MDPSIVGLIAGTLHHLFIQYPTQAKLFATFQAFAGINLVFLLLLWAERNTAPERSLLVHTIRDVLIFNTVYVPFEAGER
jgi:hypothetical protein